MFSAVNSENLINRPKAISERNKIKEMYLKTLSDTNIEEFMSMTSENLGNETYLFVAKGNILYNWAKVATIEEIDRKFKRYEVERHRNAFLMVVEKNIDENNFTKARIMLDVACKNQWFCNKYHDLRRQLDVKLKIVDVAI